MPSPSGKTPVRPSKRLYTAAETTRRPLYIPSTPWTGKEDESLTGFVLLVANDEWPSTKSPKLWEKASEFLQNICGTNRTSKFVYNSYIKGSLTCYFVGCLATA